MTIEEINQIAQQPVEDFLKNLNTHKNGLYEKTAQELLKIYGLNRVHYLKIDILSIIKKNFYNFFNILLLLATIASLIINGVEAEAVLIFTFFSISLTISVYQDYKVNKLTQKLLRYLKTFALVKRNNEWKKIDSFYLVPGDYIKVVNGDVLPADIRILKSENALIDESIITGESDFIFKTPENQINDSLNKSTLPSNIALMGTSLVKGSIEGIVFATGKKTYFGSLIKKTVDIEKTTAFEKTMSDLGKKITYGAFIAIATLFIANILGINQLNFNELLIFSIALLIAALPELLPSMTVLSLTIASIILSKKGLIVKRLSAIEDLGRIEILCTDKTGTVTTNALKFVNLITTNRKKFLKFFLIDIYFNDEIEPYQKAILDALNIGLINEVANYHSYKLIQDIAFDPLKRIKIIKVKYKNQILEIIKGAPEEIIKICFSKYNQQTTIKHKAKWEKIFYQEDAKGLRTLALAVNKQLIGIASFEDPLKKSALRAIAMAKKFNVDIKIITGDSPQVAKKTALELGIINDKDKVIIEEDINNLDDETFENIVFHHKVFARIKPESKFRIIQTLQKKKFVGFLGEGINDIMALKIANVSLVVENASDIAKQEADIILKDKDLTSIVKGIYYGRKSIQNIAKYIKHTLVGNLGNVFALSILSNFINFTPLTPVQILLTNAITDIPIISFANDKVKTTEIKKSISNYKIGFFIFIIILSFITMLANITAYLIVKDQDIAVIRTFIFMTTTILGIILCFTVRTKDWFIKDKPSRLFVITILASIILTFVIVYLSPFRDIFQFTPLGKDLIKKMFIIVLVCLGLMEITKQIFYRKFPHNA